MTDEKRNNLATDNPLMRLLIESKVGDLYQTNRGLLVLVGTTAYFDGQTDAETQSFLSLSAVLTYLPGDGFVSFASKTYPKSLLYKTPDFVEIKDAYGILKENGMHGDLPFDEFYVSLHADFQTGKRRLLVCYDGEQPASVAMTLCESETQAFFVGVATRKDKVRRGFGRTVVETLGRQIGKEMCVLFETKNQQFYSALGFQTVQKYKLLGE